MHLGSRHGRRRGACVCPESDRGQPAATTAAQSGVGNLTDLARDLTQQPDLRAHLANVVAEFNGHCHDRLGMGLGPLMLAQRLHAIRNPKTPPAEVVHTLLLHAATQAAQAYVHKLVGPGKTPSAELMLRAYHAIEAGLREFCPEQRPIFPDNQFRILTDEPYLAAVDDWASEQIHRLQASMFHEVIPNAGAVAELLLQHGGSEAEEILSIHLKRYIESAMAPLDERLDALQQAPEDQPDRPEQQDLEEYRQWSDDKHAVLARAYRQAVNSATFNTSGVWPEADARQAELNEKGTIGAHGLTIDSPSSPAPHAGGR